MIFMRGKKGKILLPIFAVTFKIQINVNRGQEISFLFVKIENV